MIAGLLLPTREFAVWGDGDPRTILDIAAAAEQEGFGSLWAGDSIVARPRLDPLTLLAAVAMRTTATTLGTAVYLPLLRPALASAHAISTLHRLAPGRLVIGVGPGASIPATDEELEALGMPTARRVGRLVDTIETWRGAWAAGADGPPVWLAAAGPRMLGLTATLFDGWLPYTPDPTAYAAALGAVRASAAGRPVVAGLYATITVAGDRDDARTELDAFLTGYYGVGLDLMGAAQACFAGPVDEAVDWLHRYAEAGAEHVVVRLGHRDLSSHRRIAAELMKGLR